eukprot:INCI13886.1.p1 GENE.INCI13886.1~~INCI13886.1.p1  ORF type:complete len:755 (-),score=145.57 INCI13886.1:1001-3028(-)
MDVGDAAFGVNSDYRRGKDSPSLRSIGTGKSRRRKTNVVRPPRGSTVVLSAHKALVNPRKPVLARLRKMAKRLRAKLIELDNSESKAHVTDEAAARRDAFVDWLNNVWRLDTTGSASGSKSVAGRSNRYVAAQKRHSQQANRLKPDFADFCRNRIRHFGKVFDVVVKQYRIANNPDILLHGSGIAVDGVIGTSRVARKSEVDRITLLHAIDEARALIAVAVRNCSAESRGRRKKVASKLGISESLYHDASNSVLQQFLADRSQAQVNVVSDEGTQSRFHDVDPQVKPMLASSLRFETAFESEDSFLRLVVDLCVAAGDILQQPQTAVEVSVMAASNLRVSALHQETLVTIAVNSAILTQEFRNFEPVMKTLRTSIRSNHTSKNLWTLYYRLKHAFSIQTLSRSDMFPANVLKREAKDYSRMGMDGPTVLPIIIARASEHLRMRSFCDALNDFLEVLVFPDAPKDLVSLCVAVIHARLTLHRACADAAKTVRVCCGALATYKRRRLERIARPTIAPRDEEPIPSSVPCKRIRLGEDRSAVANSQIVSAHDRTQTSVAPGSECVHLVSEKCLTGNGQNSSNSGAPGKNSVPCRQDITTAMEIAYNCGRTFHEIKLFVQAERCYKEVLRLVKVAEKLFPAYQRQPSIEREAAHNLAQLYSALGKKHRARQILMQFLTL